MAPAGDRTVSASWAGPQAAAGRVVVLSGPSAVGKSTRRPLPARPRSRTCISASRRRRGRRARARSTASTTTSSPRRASSSSSTTARCWNGPRSTAACTAPGTLAEPVRGAAAAGHPVLIEVDLAGARAVKQAMPEAITVFLAPPSWEALEARLDRPGDRNARGDGPPAGHRPRRTGRSGRLRRGRREQPIGVCVRRIGILAGGKSAGVRRDRDQHRFTQSHPSTLARRNSYVSTPQPTRRWPPSRDQFDPAAGG